MHGDIIYFKNPKFSFFKNNPEQKLRLALIALTYQHYDLAYSLMKELSYNFNKEQGLNHIINLSGKDSRNYFVRRKFLQLVKIFDYLKG